MSDTFRPGPASHGFMPDLRTAGDDAMALAGTGEPIGDAFDAGYAAGRDEALALAAERAQIEATAREALSLSFVRLDRALTDQLRERLRDTVAALCETAIAPLMLDGEALARRIERAVQMLTRADDDRTIRLNPDDIALIAPRMIAEWRIEPDSTLVRGAIRVETANGGVEDGPLQWRQAIAEALDLC